MQLNIQTKKEVIKPVTKDFKVNPLMKWIKLLFQSKTGTLGFFILIAVICTSIFAPVLAPHDPAATNISKMLKPPFWMDGGDLSYPLGTDNLGRDILSRLIYGSQISLLVGICSVVVAGIIGMIVGLVAGFFGGLIDNLLMRIVDSFLSIPNILFSLVILSVLNPGIITLIFVIGITNWVTYARIIRSEVLTIKEMDYIRAAKSIGLKNVSIAFKHALPNVFSSFIVVSTLSVATTIILEASLSFLGLGIQPPTVSWGEMLSSGRNYLATNWWVATFPGVAITTTVLGIILLGDWLRDVLDPRSQGRS